MNQVVAPHQTFLLADIGGTNTRVALSNGASIDESSIQRFRNSEHPNLETILEAYLAHHSDVNCTGACVAAAGPVHNGVATMTNLNWVIDPKSVSLVTGAKTVSVINDLQAQGHALGHLPPSSLSSIIESTVKDTNGTQLVVGVGTGFNAAAVFKTDGKRLVTPSECGHISMPTSSDSDLKLNQFVAREHGFACVEEVISGRGIERIYAWKASENSQAQLKTSSEILSSVEKNDDPLAHKTLDAFCRILGAVIGDLALIHLPVGGIYLVGGVARAMKPYLLDHGFRTGFRDKGRFSTFVDTFAITVIEDDYAALIGCANYLSSLTE